MKSNKFDSSLFVVSAATQELHTLKEILTSMNLQLHFATSGKEALQLIPYQHPDLILLDIQLPDFNGLDICKVLKKNPETTNIPVIFICPANDSTEKENIFKAGAIDYINKPFISKEITNRINSQLQTIKSVALKDALLVSEEKFKKAFSTTPDCVNINRIDDGTYVSLNRGFLNIFGYTEKETIGKTSIEMNIWYDINDRKRWAEELKNNGEVKNFETRFRTKSGYVFYAVVSASLIDMDGLTHVLSITRDITERKTMEEAILNQSDRLRSLHDTDIEILKAQKTVNEIINKIISDTAKQLDFEQAIAGQFDIENNSFKLLVDTNTDNNNLISTDILSGLIFKEREILAQKKHIIIEDTLNQIKHQKTKNLFITRSIKSFVVHSLTSGEKTIGAISFSWSQQKKLNQTELDIIGEAANQASIVIEQDKLRRETQNYASGLENLVQKRTLQLEEANKELEAFSYSVSHDLRAPLRHINGYVDLLTSRFTDILPEKGKHYLNTIADSTKQMGELIDDLLQFSRTGRQDLQQSIVDMNTLINEILISIKSDISKRNIKWLIAKLPNINGDPNMLKLVWQNLISNAVKFTSYKEEAVIEVGYTTEKNEHIFFVKDNGAGFDMQYAHKLFGVFQRLHYADEYEGTGIGLANVRRIILKHGGRTWATAEPNKGATFYFSITKNK